MTPTSLIDAHCHLTDERVWNQSQEWMERAQAAGLSKLMVGGLEPEEWSRQLELKKKYPDLLILSFGLHPWWVERYSREQVEQAIAKLEAEVIHSNAIGETGLDFHAKRDASRFEDQEYAFRRQVQIAVAAKKPIVLHIVKGHAPAVEIVKELNGASVPLLLHSYSGTAEMAKEWIKLGAYFSFNGGIARSDAYEKMKAALKSVPLDRILFETDAPDQGWHEDRVNEPRFIQEVYEAGAKLLNIPLSELIEKVAVNFRAFL